MMPPGVEYLKGNPIVGSFYGAINPDAKSTGGLLTSWDGPQLDERRVELLAELPTVAVPTTVMIRTRPPPPPAHTGPPPEHDRRPPFPSPGPPPWPVFAWPGAAQREQLPPKLMTKLTSTNGATGLTAMIAEDPVGALLLAAVLGCVALVIARTLRGDISSAGPHATLPVPMALGSAQPGGAAPRSSTKRRTKAAPIEDDEEEDEPLVVDEPCLLPKPKKKRGTGGDGHAEGMRGGRRKA